jgi:hypothetical protein
LIATEPSTITAHELTCTYIAAGFFEFAGILVTVDALIDTGQGVAYTPGRWAKWRGPAFIIGGIVLGCLGNIKSLHAQAAPPGPPPLVTVSVSSAPAASVIVNGLTAVGAFSAAAAAVWVALTDRGRRKKERDEAEKAQATLVRIRLRWQSLGSQDPDPYAQVIVNNWGSLPIVEVKATSWEWQGQQAQFRCDPPQAEIVMPSPVSSGDRAEELKLYPTDATTTAAMAEPTITRETDLSVTIEFTDANGTTWKRTASTPPLRHKAPVRIRGG